MDTRFVYHNLSADKGYFAFNPQFSAACPAGNTTCTTALGANPTGGFDFADYFMGTWYEQFLQNSAAPYGGHQAYSGFYGQDSWRVTTKLTVNYGRHPRFAAPRLVEALTLPARVVPGDRQTHGDYSTQLNSPRM